MGLLSLASGFEPSTMSSLSPGFSHALMIPSGLASLRDGLHAVSCRAELRMVVTFRPWQVAVSVVCNRVYVVCLGSTNGRHTLVVDVESWRNSRARDGIGPAAPSSEPVVGPNEPMNSIFGGSIVAFVRCWDDQDVGVKR